MKYKAFVASTKRDLGAYRDQIIQQLNKAQIEVDPMEDWPADPANPADLSASRTRGCHFCILLVAFQRGTIALNDGERRSITQLEVDAALKHGAKLLIFMLRDTPANQAIWAAKGYPVELATDPKLISWRQMLETRYTCEYFEPDERIESFPQVLPSVMRQVFEWEAGRRRKLLSLLLASTMALGLLASAFFASEGFRSFIFSRFMAFDDPIVYCNSRDGFYRSARLIDGSADMRDNTNLREELAATKHSFKMFANIFYVLQEYERDFDELASRGVSIQVILTDFSPENRSNWQSFHEAIGAENPEKAEDWMRSNTDLCIARLMKKHKNIEFRWNRLPILYGFWLRDDDDPSALAHWRLNYYKSQSVSDWPCFRVSKRSGGGQIDALRNQFESIWQKAVVREFP